MIKTIVSIFVTLALILGVSMYEIYYVESTFATFHDMLRSLKEKTDLNTVNYSDGLAVRSFWDEKKQVMHIWVPHTALSEIDYQLDELIGFLYTEKYDDALPKIEVVLGLSEYVPRSYTISLGNIF